MADYPYAGVRTRPMWSGFDADKSIHVEKYTGKTMEQFGRSSLFSNNLLTDNESVEGETNTLRLDYAGGTEVRTRKSGEGLERDRLVYEKDLIVVDTMNYARAFVDYMDDWTAPSRIDHIARSQGIAQATVFDSAHIKRLFMAAEWEAPADLKRFNEFADGVWHTITGYVAETDAEKKADMFIKAMFQMQEEATYRNLDGEMSEAILLVKPELYSVLLTDKRLTTMDWGGIQAGNSFVGRRMAVINGIRVLETPRFPRRAGPITANHNWSQYAFTEKDTTALAVFYFPRHTLQTVWAHGFQSKVWDDDENQTIVVENFGMYEVGIKRGDATFVIASDDLETEP